MKKIWMTILVFAVVALLAVLAYKPENGNGSDLNQNTNGELGQIQEGQTIAGNIDEVEVEDDENEDGLVNTGTTNNDTTIDAGTTNTVTTSQGITLNELSTHNSKNDCWISYKGSVYDLTGFLPVHPGGSAVISQYCGSADGFENAFTRQHGTSQVKNLPKRGIFKGNLI